MAAIGYSQLINRFQITPQDSLHFLTPLPLIIGLFTQQPQTPENINENLYDPNLFYIEPKHDNKKKNTAENKNSTILLIGKPEEKKETAEEKKRNYKAGVFATFYEINEGSLDKDAAVWYYKQHKDIVGPVSSYNMDKMLYYHQLSEETRVAFQSIDKFVKLGKIKKIVEGERREEKNSTE